MHNLVQIPQDTHFSESYSAMNWLLQNIAGVLNLVKVAKEKQQQAQQLQDMLGYSMLSVK